MTSNFAIAPQFAPVANDSLFEQRTIVELSDVEMTDVNGGTTPVCAVAVASSTYCVGGAIFLAGVAIGYAVNR